MKTVMNIHTISQESLYIVILKFLDKKGNQIRMFYLKPTYFIAIFLSLSFISMMNVRVSIAQPQRSYEQRLDQIKLYIQEGLHKQAQIELDVLLQTAKGARDVRVAQSLAINAYKLNRMTQALNHLRIARRLANNEEQREIFTTLYERWQQEYGLVQFVSKNQLSYGGINLQRARLPLNTKRREVFFNAQKDLKLGVKAPAVVYLPYGAYTANQIKFKIRRDQESPIVKLMLTPLAIPSKPKYSPKKSKISPWVYAGIGSVALIVLGVGTYYLLDTNEPAAQQFNVTATLK